MKDDRRHAVRFIVSQAMAHGNNTSPNATYKEIPDTTGHGVKTHRYCCYQILIARPGH